LSNGLLAIAIKTNINTYEVHFILHFQKYDSDKTGILFQNMLPVTTLGLRSTWGLCQFHLTTLRVFHVVVNYSEWGILKNMATE